MTDKHTAGKLKTGWYGTAIELKTEDDRFFAQLSASLTEADARRLAAAWNPCDTISTEALEAGVVKALLAACRAARVEMIWLNEQRKFRPGGSCDQAVKLLDAALALAEAPQ